MRPVQLDRFQQLRTLQRRRKHLLFKLFASHLYCQLLRIKAIITCVQLILLVDSNTKKRVTWGGRTAGSKNLKRRKTSTWFMDYLGPSPVYTALLFRRRFAVPRTLFYKLRHDLLQFNPSFWEQRRRGVGALGHTTEQRLLSALRILSSGCSADSLDDGSVMSEQCVLDSIHNFCNDVIAFYGPRFLNRRPTRQELDIISSTYESVGFPGCIGSVDCMKLFWKNCPFYEKGQLLNTKESSKLATVVCEAWCDHDLYCWHWFPGRAGTNNDLTVLYSSPLFQDIFNGLFNISKSDGYTIPPSTAKRIMNYFLVDGIYPDWPIFAKPIHNAVNIIKKFFSARQEATRKDVERLFGVLQSRFGVLRLEFETWDLTTIIAISNTCVILHNMIIRMQQDGEFYEEVGDINVVTELLEKENYNVVLSREEYIHNVHLSHTSMQCGIEEFVDDLIMNELHLTDNRKHDSLMTDLANHIYKNKNKFV